MSVKDFKIDHNMFFTTTCRCPDGSWTLSYANKEECEFYAKRIQEKYQLKAKYIFEQNCHHVKIYNLEEKI
jgi:hypothetical protein